MPQPSSLPMSASSLLGVTPDTLTGSGINNVVMLVPQHQWWQLLLAEIDVTTGPETGDRQYYLKHSASNKIYNAGAVVGNSTIATLQWSPSLETETEIQASADKNGQTYNNLNTRTNLIYLRAGESLEIADSGIKSAGDSMLLKLFILRSSL